MIKSIIELSRELLVFVSARRKRIEPSNVFHDSNVGNSIIKSVVNGPHLSVDCFFIVLAHNGGKKLNPFTLQYTSVMSGEYKTWLMPTFDITDHKNVESDHDHREFLSSIYEDRRKGNGINWHVEMADDNLKAKYSFENVKFLKCFFLHYSDVGMWFAMVGTTQEGELFDDINHKQRIFYAVNKIKNIIKKY